MAAQPAEHHYNLLFMLNSSYCFFRRTGKTVAAVFLCLLLASDGLYAQSYYHLRVQVPGSRDTCNFFLRMEAAGAPTLRIRAGTAEQPLLAEIELTDTIHSPTERYLQPATNPRTLEGDGADTLWLPVLQFERRNEGNGFFYEPTGVRLVRNGVQQTARFVHIRQLSFEALSAERSLARQFYQLNDPFFILLTGFTTRSLNTEERRRRLYLLVVANTNDPSIGASSQKDLEGITELFTTFTRQAGIALVPVVVSGNAFNIGNVRRILDTIRPNPADIVFFYYSGHGFRFANDTSKYPRISFRTNNLQVRNKNNLAVEDVYRRLQRKGARVTLVVSDCCNERLGASVPFGMDLLRPRSTGTEGLKLNFDQLRRLFFPPQPVSIVIASAAPNQLAAGNLQMGGFFTNFFRAELTRSLYTNTGEGSWLRLALNASESTRRQSLTAVCTNTPNVQGRCVQRAEVRVLPPM